MIDFDFLEQGQGILQVDKLLEILQKYRYYLQDKQAYKDRLDHLATFCRVQMSVDSSPYGIFFPEERILQLYFGKTNGRTTKNVEKASHRYYLDEQGRVHATETLDHGRVLNVRFYYYFEGRVEMVEYKLLSKKIESVGEICYLSSDSFSYTYGRTKYNLQENIVGISFFDESIIEEKYNTVTITTLKTDVDIEKSIESGTIVMGISAKIRTLTRTEAYFPKPTRKKSNGLSNISFEDHLYNKVKSVITTWGDKDIYAISFFVNSNESNCYGNYSNLSTFSISYNTEEDCECDEKYAEQRWNYAFWRQNEHDIIDMDDTDSMLSMLFKWYKTKKVKRLGEETDDCCTSCGDYIGKGPNGHYELLMLVAEVAKRLQNEGTITQHFGKDLPIIVHGLEYAWYDIEATKIANPQGQAQDFLITMENL